MKLWRRVERPIKLSPYFERSDRGTRCTLCPNSCLIKEGSQGLCQVRHNRNGEITLPYYGVISAEAVDPVEKKPLYHFKPGTRTYSIGFYGCSLHCPFCQNHSISLSFASGSGGIQLSPEELIRRAKASGTPSISFTYSEPAIHAEFILEASRIAHREGLSTILVTNGYLNPAPAGELLRVIDAVNVDLKAFRKKSYPDHFGGALEPVKRFIELASSLSVHLEITTLIVPGINDDLEELERAADYIAGVDRDIPWHLSAYHPAYHYHEAATEGSFLFAAATRAKEELSFVYPGNRGASWPTICPGCGELMIERQGFGPVSHLSEEGCCSGCGREIVKI